MKKKKLDEFNEKDILKSLKVGIWKPNINDIYCNENFQGESKVINYFIINKKKYCYTQIFKNLIRNFEKNNYKKYYDHKNKLLTEKDIDNITAYYRLKALEFENKININSPSNHHNVNYNHEEYMRNYHNLIEDFLQVMPFEENQNRENIGKKINWKHINERKSKKGKIAEEKVLEEEKKQLKLWGVNKKIIHISQKDGDGLGYDILSYDRNGNEKYIEVKSFDNNDIYLTKNELEFLKSNINQYYIYLVKDIRNPQITIVSGKEILKGEKYFKPILYKIKLGIIK